MNKPIIRVDIRCELDVVTVHQRARLIANIIGFSLLDQTRISTAVSEIAHNALIFGRGGTAEFSISGSAPAQWLTIVVSDQGPGIADLSTILQERPSAGSGMGLGIIGSQRLLPENFHIDTKVGGGTRVTLNKLLPPNVLPVTPAILHRIADALAVLPTTYQMDELRTQNQTLLTALETLQQREAELSDINTELIKTNSGVTALYVDLKDKAQKLAQANQALEVFNYSVAHDLRTPLRGIDGWSLVLQEDYADRLDDNGRQYLQRIRSDAQRMSQLIDDMLRLSKVSAAAMQIGAVNLSEMAEKIIDHLRITEPQRQVSCVIQKNLTVSGHSALLQIALTNLLDNAWKFTRKNPHASIELGCLALAAPTDAPVFFVRDNGAGFDMKYAQNLFAPFNRLHTELEFPGTGIGLATVQRILQRHGGRAWAEAEIDKGATFYFQVAPHVSRESALKNSI